MKTRIVYPKLWLDEKFAVCSVETKLLFMYLVTSGQLALSRYHHITDRQIMFDTGLSLNRLKTGKEELSRLKWCFFTENWVFHNHKCAYIDYSGRDRVLESKKQEIADVPKKVKEVFKGLITGYKPVLNSKSKTINPKPETLRGKHLPKKGEVTVKQMTTIAENYRVPLKFVQSKWDDVLNYCHANDKRYTDFSRVLSSFVKKDAGNNVIKGSAAPKKIKPVSAAERARVQKRMDNMRKKNPLLIKKIPPLRA